MSNQPHNTTIHGINYTIGVTPGESGIELAFELNRLVGTSVYMSQQAISDAFDALSMDERKALGEGTEEERQQKYMDLIVPKISTEKMMEAAIVMLRDLKPAEMLQLAKKLFKEVLVNNAPLNMNAHFASNYKSVIPLMAEVIRFNGFLDLDATDLLRINSD